MRTFVDFVAICVPSSGTRLTITSINPEVNILTVWDIQPRIDWFSDTLSQTLKRSSRSAEPEQLLAKKHSEDIYETIPDGPGKLGFQILYGPPFREAPLLFIGYQPGTGLKSPEQEREYGSEDGWPSVGEFATENWVLAKNMRRMFGRELLQQCAGVNAIFVRSPSLEHYRKHVTLELRREIEKFCLIQITEMVEALRPKMVLVMGFETLALFGKSKAILKNEMSQRVLAKTGSVARRQAIGTLHLSGARISTPDRPAMARYILAALSLD